MQQTLGHDLYDYDDLITFDLETLEIWRDELITEFNIFIFAQREQQATQGEFDYEEPDTSKHTITCNLNKKGIIND